MQDNSENLGKLVREARIGRNLTQLELAELIDKSERTVVKIEKRRRKSQAGQPYANR